MPLSSEDQAKLDQITAAPYQSWRVGELVAVHWPEPDGTIHYCSTPLEELEGYEFLAPRGLKIEPRFAGNQFLDIEQTDDLADDKIDLEFWDGDEHENGVVVRTSEITRLYHTHGAGMKVEVFYYFPQVDLLLLAWWGHLQPPSEGALEWFKTTAEFGFLSSMLPLPRRGHYSSCSNFFGGLLKTQDEIDDNDCPYNLQIEGGDVGELDPDTGLPFTSCPRNNRAACIARIGDDLSYTGSDTPIQSYVVGQTKGPNITVTTQSNQNNLKQPRRVIFGERHVTNLDVVGYSIEPDTKHPEGGAVACVFEICEGPIAGQSGQKINNTLVGYQHLQVRNGELRQARTGLSKDTANHSGTALFFGRIQGDFTKITAADLRGEVDVRGLRDVRVYSDPETYVKQYSTDRAWALARIEADKRWGRGRDYSRLYIADFIALSAWHAEAVTVHDKDGNTVTGPRSTFNAELIGRSAQQQVSDICLAGRCSLPYPDDSGQIRIQPLRRVPADDLAVAPVFTDFGEDRNIVVDDAGRSTFTWSEQTDKELANRILLTYDDATQANTSVPLIFEDELQQLRAGRAFGDFTRDAVEKPYAAFGVTDVGEAGRLGNLLLDLGEFDEGGLKNNLRVQFTTWWTFTIALLKYQVVKVRTAKLDIINAIREDQGLERFDYFRIRTRRRLPNLRVELSLQAYPVAYYERLESSELPPPIVPSFPDENPGGGRGKLPFKVGLIDLSHTDDRVAFELGQPEVP